MEKKRRQLKWLWIALALIVLATLTAVLVWLTRPLRDIPPVTDSLDISIDPDSNWDKIIAYVPLDDRTDNIEDVVYMAEASGYDIILPPGDTYCTKLDGQEPNSNGTQYGDRETLFTWVREMEDEGCNLYILSLDQLFSGGLVNSRALTGTAELTFDDGTVMTETEAFDRFILSLSEDPKNRVYLFDSVVRLASTVGYQGFGLDEYNALRTYGMEARPVLDSEDVTLEQVFASYRYGVDGVTSAQEGMDPDSRAVLTDEMIEDYLNIRMRKLRLTDHVISAMESSGNDNIKLIIGIDDSSSTNNIQFNELHYIAQRVGGGSSLMTGLDSLARLLVGKIAQEQYGHQIKAYLRYFGGSQSAPSSEFDRYSLEETVDMHMELFGAQKVNEEDAELQVLIMTAPDDPNRAQEYCKELVGQLEYNAQNHIPTILLEASNNAYGVMLEDMLFERVDFANLIAFAGKYDQAIVTGAAFSMGFSRYLYLACQDAKDSGCDDAHIRQIANSMALTYPYILHTRAELNEYIQRLGCNHNNILTDNLRRRLIQDKLEDTFLPLSEKVSENLEGGRVITSLEPYAEEEAGSVCIRDVYFPWNRTFEISFTIDVG